MSDGAERRFEWHPARSGQTGAEARDALRAEIAGDQRAYALALSGADAHENDALASIVALERKWGPLAMDWAELDAGQLADAAVAAEWEREAAREMIPFGELRDRIAPPASEPAFDDYPEKSLRLTDPQARLAVLVVVLGLAALLIWRIAL